MKKEVKILSKFFAITLVVLALFLVGVVYKNIKEEKERKELLAVGYTEYDLDSFLLARLFTCLDICPPEYRKRNFFEKYEYNWEKKDLELKPGEKTEELLEKFNDLLFHNPQGGKLKAAAEKYGFSKENNITLEWILTHPKETCEIIEADRSLVRTIR